MTLLYAWFLGAALAQDAPTVVDAATADGGELVTERPGEPLSLTLDVTEFTSKPLRLTVPLDRKVRLAVTNTGTITHSFRIADLLVGTDALQPGETQVLEFVPRATGAFLFECGISGHDEVGVPGHLVVEERPPQNVLRRSM